MWLYIRAGIKVIHGGCLNAITVTSHERNGITNHRQLDYYRQQFVQAKNKENAKAQHQRRFVRETTYAP